MAGSCCGKPNPGPHGSQKPQPQSKPKPTTSGTSMAANTQSFTLAMNSGEKIPVNGSLLEAQAKLARMGGRGSIR